ncbi:hypothetical protein B0A79_23825 [Flavobacterium piscis]|uniref:Uncharacterized protein n=1 Tax=Flavobacterium piscis TaxID=1114874 RepID=A0ABX2XJQ8_9FLAO|nr:hypothetical protein [Flavobacterium piscis]OCB75545.1 hypothetical protein FLP_08750 [Flavobacterium piscis]OXE95921.1 hypothetical protein B0A79_23825 [Flavobacterium piscis]
MILHVLDNSRYFKFLVIILLAITTLLCVLLVDHRRQTLKLEIELANINQELQFKEFTHDRKMKEFEQEAKRHQEQVQQLKSEILSKLKRENENRH